MSLYVTICSEAFLKVCLILKILHASILDSFFSELFRTARHLSWVWSIMGNCHVINYCFIHQILKLLTTDLEHHLCSHRRGPFLSQQGTAGTNSAEQSGSRLSAKVGTSKSTVSHIVHPETWRLLRKVSNTWSFLPRSITCSHWFAAKYFSVSIST